MSRLLFAFLSIMRILAIGMRYSVSQCGWCWLSRHRRLPVHRVRGREMDNRRAPGVSGRLERLGERDHGSSNDARWGVWIEHSLERDGDFLAGSRTSGRDGVQHHLIAEGFSGLALCACADSRCARPTASPAASASLVTPRFTCSAARFVDFLSRLFVPESVRTGSHAGCDGDETGARRGFWPVPAGSSEGRSRCEKEVQFGY